MCPECGGTHEGLITCFGPDEPHAWHRATLPARLLGRLSRSMCRVSLDGQRRFFARGHLHIPLSGHPEPSFVWNIWVEVRPEDADRIERHWYDPARIQLPPIGAILETRLPYETLTSGLAVQLHERPPGEVPHISVTAVPDHPLQREQQAGMTLHRLAELNQQILGAPVIS
jgi:hypothetical protein